MLISCTTKGCMATTEAKLDRDTGEVICEACGNPVAGITEFMKKGLQSVGQVLRWKVKQAFQASCQNCHQNRSLYVKEDKAYCKVCNAQINVSASFLIGLKQHLESQD